jgi:vancomycin permeability regulator SanA
MHMSLIIRTQCRNKVCQILEGTKCMSLHILYITTDRIKFSTKMSTFVEMDKLPQKDVPIFSKAM